MTKTAKDQTPESRTQAEKFADMARELECDEDEEAFGERLRRMAPAVRKTPSLPGQDSK